MAIRLEQLRHKMTDAPMRAFFIRNAANKVLAIGALRMPHDDGFVMMKAKRYENDGDLVRAIEKLTGMNVRRCYTK